MSNLAGICDCGRQEISHLPDGTRVTYKPQHVISKKGKDKGEIIGITCSSCIQKELRALGARGDTKRTSQASPPVVIQRRACASKGGTDAASQSAL